jgi:hypothetical protein
MIAWSDQSAQSDQSQHKPGAKATGRRTFKNKVMNISYNSRLRWKIKIVVDRKKMVLKMFWEVYL